MPSQSASRPPAPGRRVYPPGTELAVTGQLRAAGCVFAEEEARLLMCAASTPAELGEMVRQRVSGLPLEHVVGWAEFCGLRIIIEPGVFVPRRRTEFLVSQATAIAGRRRARCRPVIVDLCCGSGAVGAAVAAAVPDAELHAVDIEDAAVRCARRNLARFAGQVHQGDLYQALPARLRGHVSVLLANAPYVPTDAIGLLPAEARVHEPRTSLDGGADGLDIVRRVIASAGRWLEPGGHLLVETSERQAPLAIAAAIGTGLTAALASSQDLGATVLIARRPVAAAG